MRWWPHHHLSPSGPFLFVDGFRPRPWAVALVASGASAVVGVAKAGECQVKPLVPFNRPQSRIEGIKCGGMGRLKSGELLNEAAVSVPAHRHDRRRDPISDGEPLHPLAQGVPRFSGIGVGQSAPSDEFPIDRRSRSGRDLHIDKAVAIVHEEVEVEGVGIEDRDAVPSIGPTTLADSGGVT